MRSEGTQQKIANLLYRTLIVHLREQMIKICAVI